MFAFFFFFLKLFFLRLFSALLIPGSAALADIPPSHSLVLPRDASTGASFQRGLALGSGMHRQLSLAQDWMYWLQDKVECHPGPWHGQRLHAGPQRDEMVFPDTEGSSF